jgi:hypothetical protein
MRLLLKLFGLGLIILGIYWLGQNLILTSRSAYYWWQPIPATGSVLLMLGGLWTLFNASGDDRNFAWILIGGAIALIFMSGGVMIRPTSLWQFLLGFSALFGGFKLIQGRALL